MPTTSHRSNSIDPRRFAGLFAGFDICNTNEEEAINKGRALRQMAIDAGSRVIDLLEWPDIREAIDKQLQPTRHDDDRFEEAVSRAEEMQQELLERVQDAQVLADAVRDRDALIAQMEEAISLLRQQGSSGPIVTHHPSLVAPSIGAQSWVFEAAIVTVFVMTSVAAICSGSILERSNNHGLASNRSNNPSLVRKSGTVLSVPNHRALPRGLHRSHTPARSR